MSNSINQPEKGDQDQQSKKSIMQSQLSKRAPQTTNDIVILGYPRNDEEKHCFPYFDFVVSICLRFDISFIYILVVENINFGLWILVGLAAQDFYKSYMNCDPAEMAVYGSLQSLPWSLKVIYGLITDNVKICGLKRKPYIIFFGYLQSIVMFSLYFFKFDSGLQVALLLMTASFSMAFSNVVVDAILIVQSRKDSDLGSQDLMSLAWLTQGLAGVVGCIVAAIMMEKYNPRYAFLGYGIYGLFVGTSCFFLSSEVEREYIIGEEPIPSEFSSELLENQTPSEAVQARKVIIDARPPLGEEGFWWNFKKNMRAIGHALLRREIYCVVLYFILDGITSPSFSDFTYFFLMNVVGVSKFIFAMITLVGQICSVIGVILYEKFLKRVEVRTILFFNVIIGIFGAFLAYAFAMRWNLSCGINDLAFLFFTNIVFGTVSIAFSTLPIMALFAKITPRRIEGTMFAFLTGTSNLDGGVIQPMMGAWINNQFVGVNKDDLSQYSTLMLISFIASFLGFAILPLIPKRQDIDDLNAIRAYDELEEAVKKTGRRRLRYEKRQEYKDNNKKEDDEGGEFEFDPLIKQ